MLIYLDLLVLCYMPCFPMLCSSFSSRIMLGLHAHILVWRCWLCLAWIYVSVCLFPCYMVRSLSSHAYMLGFVFFHAFMLTSICLDVHSYAYMHISMLIFTCLDLCSLHALCHHLCACLLHALFMCLGLNLVCHAMCYCSPFVPFFAFSCVLA